MNNTKITFDEWYNELVKVFSLFEIKDTDLDKESYKHYYDDHLSPVDCYKEECILSNS